MKTLFTAVATSESKAVDWSASIYIQRLPNAQKTQLSEITDANSKRNEMYFDQQSHQQLWSLSYVNKAPFQPNPLRWTELTNQNELTEAPQNAPHNAIIRPQKIRAKQIGCGICKHFTF